MIEPREPQRPLWWPDTILDLKDKLQTMDQPIYIVGGAVRDAFLHQPIHDIDLITPQAAISLGRQIAKRLEADFFILDEERDVARILFNTPEGRLIIDLARFRGDDLRADLTDRDFTINAMAVHLQGDLEKIIDPLNGEKDLITPVIRRCSDHAISDDPIRTLRAVRQSVQFKARIEPDTLLDLRAYAENIVDTSPERVRDEVIKLLRGHRPAAALRIADTLGLLKVIIPEVEPLHGLEQLPPHVFDAWGHTLMMIEKLNGILQTISPTRTIESAASFDYGMVVMALDLFRKPLQAHISQTWADERPHSALLLLAALLHGVGKPNGEGDNFAGYIPFSAEVAERIAVDLRLSNHEKQRIIFIIRNQSALFKMPVPLTDLEMHRFWHQAGAAGVDLCLLALADHLATVGSEIKQDVWLLLLEQVQKLLDAFYHRHGQVVQPPPLVDGTDLMTALNLSPGKKIGELLTFIREGQVTGEITSIDEAIEAARDQL